MREIKFRAYDKSWEDEEYSGMRYDITDLEFIDGKLTGVYIDGDYFDIKNVELMQYTRLKDKNGKEIYEGDILLAPVYFGSLKCVCIYQQENIVSSIQGFGLYSYDSYFQKYRTLVESDEWDDFEVIGNIYDNPELLED